MCPVMMCEAFQESGTEGYWMWQFDLAGSTYHTYLHVFNAAADKLISSKSWSLFDQLQRLFSC